MTATSYLLDLLGIRSVKSAGVAVPASKTVNFTGGLSAEYNPSTKAIDVSGEGGGGGTLSSVLAAGNTTGANNIIVSTGADIRGQTGVWVHGAGQSQFSTDDVLSGSSSGELYIITGNAVDQAAGSLSISAGNSTSGAGGGVSIAAGSSDATAGPVTIQGGNSGTGTPGYLLFAGGSSDTLSGSATLKSGDSGGSAGVDSVSGDAHVRSGDISVSATGTTLSGDVNIQSGDNLATGGTSGDVNILAGSGDTRGAVVIGALGHTVRVGGYTLPAADGTSGQVLSTDGAGNLSWITP